MTRRGRAIAIAISIVHDIGHILGARRDRPTDPNNSPFPYRHGFVDGRKSGATS
jgi:hypothetical protein